MFKDGRKRLTTFPAVRSPTLPRLKTHEARFETRDRRGHGFGRRVSLPGGCFSRHNGSLTQSGFRDHNALQGPRAREGEKAESDWHRRVDDESNPETESQNLDDRKVGGGKGDSHLLWTLTYEERTSHLGPKGRARRRATERSVQHLDARDFLPNGRRF